MSLATGESKKNVSRTSWLGLSWGVRFMIAVAGAAVSFWLASRQDAHKLPPLPNFNERFWLVAPTLFAGAAGILFLIWAGLLFREAEHRSAPKIISSATTAEAAGKKRWTVFKWVLFVAFILVTVPSFGGNYLKYLWPSYPEWISRAAQPIFDLLGFVGAIVASYNRRKKQTPQPGTGFGAERVPWLDERQKAFIFVTLVGAAIIIGIIHSARNLPPSSMKRIVLLSLFILAAIQVTILRALRKADKNAPHSDIQARSLVAGEGRPQRRKLAGKVAVWIIIALMMATVISPIPREFKTAAFFAPIGILVIWGVALTKLRRWTYGLARSGEFDRAIQIDRRLTRIPGYGTPLEGPILFNAGRYAEARAFVKPFAFDEQGQPRLTSTEFYTYALTLENDGLEAEAQKLLEAAVQVPQRTAGFHVALATCLLSQKKDAKRACELLEQALATSDLQSSSYGRNSDHAMRIARYAWALAACGRRQEAEAKIREALVGSAALKKRDLAGLQYFAGEMWRSLSEWKKAREAFDEALRLSPDGSAATSTKKALANMRVEARA